MKLKQYFPLTLLLLGNVYVAGGPPTITDDPETPSNNNFEVNIAYAGDLRSNTRRYEQPLIDINYGVGENIQFKIESSYVSLFGDGNTHTKGIENAKVGIKWRFYENDSGDLLTSTYPQYSFTPVRKSLDNGIAEIDQALFLPIEISKKIEGVVYNR